MSGVPVVRLSAYYFLYFAFIGIFMPYFALYLQSRGHTAAAIATLMSVMQVMRLAAPNLWGWLADVSGQRMPIVRLAAALSLVGFAGILLSNDFWGLAVAIAVMGFFWTAQHPLTEALTLAHLRDTPSRYGSIRAWGSIGFIAASMPMGWWLDRAGYHWVIWAGLAMLAAIAVSACLVPEARAPLHEETDAAPISDILRRRPVQALLVAGLLMSAAHGALYVFYSIHLVDAGYSKSVVGAMWTLGVLLEILVFLRAPQWLARISVRSMLIFTFACAALRFLIIGWCVESVGLLLLAQCMHGITFGAYHAAAVAAIHRWFGERHQARGQALYGSLSFGAGGIVGSVVSGILWSSAGPGWTYTAGSFFALLGLIVLWRGWRPDDIVEK